MDMEDMVPLGYGIMSFVKYINRYALIPIFYFLSGFISNYAIIIMLMTIFIRLKFFAVYNEVDSKLSIIQFRDGGLDRSISK